jgi:N-acetylglutamate synthase-like GNAT family acetyltransferase
MVRDDPPGLQVRPFRQSDLAVVRDLVRQLGYEIAEAELTHRIAGVLEAADHRFVVAELGGRVVGMLHVFRRPALEKPCEAVVQAIVIDADARGQGLGRALMRLAEEWARAQGLSSIALHTRKARAFYEGLGYDHVASSDLMRKTL